MTQTTMTAKVKDVTVQVTTADPAEAIQALRDAMQAVRDADPPIVKRPVARGGRQTGS